MIILSEEGWKVWVVVVELGSKPGSGSVWNGLQIKMSRAVHALSKRRRAEVGARDCEGGVGRRRRR